MVRTPDYSPVMIEGLQDQIVAILQRDFSAHLAAVAPSAAYADTGINRYHKLMPDIAFENAPEAIVEVVTTTIEQNDQQSLTCTHSLAVSVVICSTVDSETLAQQARDYARALVMALARAADYSDYWEPLPISYEGETRQTTGMPAGSVKGVMVRSVNWGMKGALNQQIGRMPAVELEITTEEL